MSQRIITYTNSDGHRKVYSTAYGDDEIRRQVALCRARHGVNSDVHSQSNAYPLPKS